MVTTTQRSISFTANGSTTVFAFPFMVMAGSDLIVVSNGLIQDTGAYSVSGVGVESGGSVTFVAAPTATWVVSITRTVPNLQGTDFPNAGFVPAVLERALDRLTLQIQDSPAAEQQPAAEGSHVVNVMNYGAVANGTTDDSFAVNAAVAALVDRSVLYFPAGVYRCSTFTLSGLSGVSVRGDGPGVSTIRNNNSFAAGVGGLVHPVTVGARVINVDKTCDHIEVTGLTFDGNCIYRKPGQQAVTIDASYTTFHNNETVNSGEFANQFGRNRDDGDPMLYLNCHHNMVGMCFADGYNLHRQRHATVSDNIVDGADDDLIAISQSVDVVVANNVCLSRRDVLRVSVGAKVLVILLPPLSCLQEHLQESLPWQ